MMIAQLLKAIMIYLPHTNENLQVVREASAGSRYINDKAVMVWLWVNAENVTEAQMAMLIASLVPCWHPYVHVRGYNHRILKSCAWNMTATLKSAERRSFAELTIHEPQYGCSDAGVPERHDVLDDADSDVSGVGCT